jgi:hypothetical protein
VVSLAQRQLGPVIQLAVGKTRTFLQIKRAICGAGQFTINVMVKEINKSKSLELSQIFWRLPNDVRIDGKAFPFFAAEPGA